ncbi:WEB family protein [Canna indica]|uniref:WEB family protein n=1 Tax=Canna indica TaxID=4628 RepID=A0AAQ3K3Y3_9LILI|nr:WEB family protein [Canna indica]
MLNKLKQAEYASAAAYEAAEEAKSETLRLKERLLDKENELQNITQENDDLRIKETAALHKIKELYSLLEEATTKRTDDKNELSKTGKEYDPLPNISQNMSSHERVVHYHADNQKTNEENKKGVHNDEEEDPTCTMSKDLASEKDDEDESRDDDAYSKIHGAIFEQTNSMTESTEISPTMNQQKKKKKPLLEKLHGRNLHAVKQINAEINNKNMAL